MTRPITFLSDYGYADEFAGVCRAVIARIAPDAQLIDITHGLARHAVRQGAVLLANSLPFAAPGVHLAVVDPGVGSERRPVAVAVAEEERILVGPDNGVLALAIERFGGAARGSRPDRLAVPPATCHRHLPRPRHFRPGRRRPRRRGRAGARPASPSTPPL